MLNYSKNHPKISLIQLNGSTSTHSDVRHDQASGTEYRLRAPLTNLRILYALNELTQQKGDIRKQDLVDAILREHAQDYPDTRKFADIVKTHLRRLDRAGILTYTARPYSENFISYRFKDENERPEGEPPKSTWGGKHTLVWKVYDTLLHNSDTELDRETLFQRLLERNPDIAAKFASGELQKPAFMRKLSFTVGHLVRTGYVEHIGFNNVEQATISMKDEQRQAIRDYVGLIEKFRTQDPAFLAEGRRKATEIADDPVWSSNLLKKAREHSPEANQIPQAQTARRILEYIRLNPGTTIAELRTYLNEYYEQLIGKGRVGTIVRKLERNNFVTSKIIRGKLKGLSAREAVQGEEEAIWRLFQ